MEAFTKEKKMTTADQMYRYMRANHLGGYILPLISPWLQKKHFQVLEESFIDGEWAEYAFVGKHLDYDDPEEVQANGEKFPEPGFFKSQGYYAYAITNKNRLIYTRWRPFFHKISSIPMNDIKNIEPITHIIWGHVKIESMGDCFSLFWTKNAVKRIAKVIQQGVSEVKNANIESKEAVSDAKYYDTKTIFETLQDAKQSMEAGLITSEEYEHYKAKVLGRDV